MPKPFFQWGFPPFFPLFPLLLFLSPLQASPNPPVVLAMDKASEQAIWQEGKAEWLTYKVKLPHKGHTWSGDAQVITQAQVAGKTSRQFHIQWSRMASGPQGKAIQQADILWNTLSGRLEAAKVIHGRLPDKMDAWTLIIVGGQYQKMNWSPDGGTPKAITIKAPLILEEALIFEARNWPLASGFSHEAWWIPMSGKSSSDTAAIYVRVDVPGKPEIRHDLMAWRVSIKPAQGRGAEIWVQASGTHPVIEATWSDGSNWVLEEIQRR